MKINDCKNCCFYYDEDDDSPYAGTYVHDVEGWDDEMIADALDGEPEAYWNID